MVFPKSLLMASIEDKKRGKVEQWSDLRISFMPVPPELQSQEVGVLPCLCSQENLWCLQELAAGEIQDLATACSEMS